MSGDNERRPGPLGAGRTDKNTCESIELELPLTSVTPVAFDLLSIGDVCDVTLIIESGTYVIAIFKGQQMVGGVFHDGGQLKNCLRNGFEYKATVRSIRSGLITVYVESKGD